MGAGLRGPMWSRYVATGLAGFHVVELFQATMNIHLFDALRSEPGKGHRVASLVRVVTLSVWNFFELIICFGILYASPWACLTGASSRWDAFYFSAITQFTIGYGDIVPIGWTRAVVMVQTGIGFLFALFALSRMISLLPKVDAIFKAPPGEDAAKSPKDESGR